MGFDIADYKIQGYLLANAEELIETAGRNRSDTSEPQPRIVKKAISPGNQATLDTQSDLFNSFSNVNQVDYVSDLPGDVRTYKLRPKIRIFKTLRKKGTPHEVDLELKKSFNGDGQSTLLGSNSGVTLSDVEIVRLGGNPAEVDTNIKVTITLYATKLGHFFDIQKPTPRPNFPGDMGEAFAQQSEKGVAWIDLLKINLAEGGASDALTRFVNDYGTSLAAGGRAYELGTAETAAQVKASVGGDISEPDQRIKLELGYDDIDDIEDYSQDEIDKIKALVASQREVFYLSLTQHDINFNWDGTVNITISYIGSGGANVISRENDILFDPYLYEIELRHNDEICKLKKGLKGTNEDRIERDKKTIKVRDAFKRANKKQQAMLLNNGLYGPALLLGTPKASKLNGMKAEARKSRIYCNLVNLKDMTSEYISGELSTFGGKPITANYFDYLLGRYSGVKEGGKAWYNPMKLLSAVDLDNLKLVGELEVEKDLALSETTEDFDKNLETGSRFVEAGAWSNDEDGLLAQFVFLGDIFEVALEVLAKNNRFSTDESFESKFFKGSPDIVTTKTKKEEKAYTDKQQGEIRDGDESEFTLNEGSFVRPFYWNESSAQSSTQTTPSPPANFIEQRVYDEFGEFLFSDITYQDPSDSTADIKISLADLPISLFRYKQWFINKILAPRRSTLFLKDFIQLLMNDLVAKILSERYSPNETSDREPPELLINRFNVPAEYTNFLDFPFPAGHASNSRTVSMINLTIGEVENPLTVKQLTLLSQSPVVVNNPPANQTRKEADREKNIPHITFGAANTGILHEVQFQREDMPGLREARLFEGSDFHGPGIIPEKYNCTLDLIGTSAFKPGSILYINPAPLDLGYSKDFGSPARAMGLGGYYLVIRVTHSVSLQGESKWRTKLDTQWQSFGDEDPLRRKSKSSTCKPTSLKERLKFAVDLEDPEDRRAVKDDMRILKEQSKE